MPKSRQLKQQMFGEYQDRVSRAQAIVWSGFKSLTVQQAQDIRAQLRPLGAEMMVVKNTVIHKALTESELPYDEAMMSGANVVTFMYDDIAGATKVIADYARTHEAFFQVKGGLLGGSVLNASQVAALVDLPSRDVLLSRVVGSMQAPITNFVSVLAGVMRGLVNVLDARAKQIEGSPS